MAKKKKLYIDIDGVVGDLVAAVLSYNSGAEVKNPYTYNLEDMFSNVDNDIIFMPELYNLRNFMLYPFVGQVLRRLQLLDFEIMFVSARPNSIHIETTKTLAQLLLTNPYELHSGLHPSKEKLIKIRDDIILNDITHAWVIEDNPRFIMDIAGWYLRYPEMKSVIKTLVYAQTYNCTEHEGLIHMLPEFTVVMNWKHIEREILQ